MARPRTPQPIQDFIHESWRNGRLPKQIRADIEADPELKALGVPAPRTIQKYIGEYLAGIGAPAPGGKGRYWRLADGDGDVLLPVLRDQREALARVSEPARRARWAVNGLPTPLVGVLVQIIRAKPSIPPGEARELAHAYLRWSSGLPEGYYWPGLEDYLAFEPWTDDGAAYVMAAEADVLSSWPPLETRSTRERIAQSEVLQEKRTQWLDAIVVSEEEES